MQLKEKFVEICNIYQKNGIEASTFRKICQELYQSNPQPVEDGRSGEGIHR